MSIKFKKGNDGLLAVRFYKAKDGAITTSEEGEKMPYDLSQVQSLKATLIRGFDSKKIQTIARLDGDNCVLIEVSKDLDHGKYSVEVSFDIPANSLEDKMQTRTFRVSGFEIVRSDDKTEDAIATIEYVDVQGHAPIKSSQEIIAELSLSLQAALEAQKKLNEDKARIEGELKQAIQELEAATADDEADEAEKERLAGQVKRLETELDTAKSSAEELSQSLDETRTTLEQVNAENTAGKARIAQLEAELATSNSDKERLTGELTQAQEALNKALANDATDKAEIQRLTDEVNTITANLQTATERAETLTQELEAAREEVRTKTAKVEELTASIETAENRKKELEAELTQAQKDLENAQADDEADDAKIAELQGQVETLNNEISSANSNISTLTQELNTTKEELRIAKENDATDTQRIRELTEENTNLKSENSALQSEKADYEKNIKGVRNYLKKQGDISNNIITHVRPGEFRDVSLFGNIHLDAVEEIGANAFGNLDVDNFYFPSLKRVGLNAFSSNGNTSYQIHIPKELFREYKNMSTSELAKMFVPNPYSPDHDQEYEISLCNISPTDPYDRYITIRSIDR